MPEVALVEAVNLALAHEMQADENVIVLGEDVGVNGGVFRATVGLQERFGKERVMDTPLAETLIAGVCIGMRSSSWVSFTRQSIKYLITPRDCAIAHAGGLPAPWCCARRSAAVSMRRSITPRARKPCSLISPGFASLSRRHR
jgi:pyruvate dehydrogenase E1 component beta subunit